MDSPPEYDWRARLIAVMEALDQEDQPIGVNLEPDGNNQAGHVPRQPAEPASETAGADAANTTREAAMSPEPEELITPPTPREILAQLAEQSASIDRHLEELFEPSLSARRRVMPTQRPRGTGDVVQPSRWPAGNINRVLPRFFLYPTPKPDNDTTDESGSDSDEE